MEIKWDSAAPRRHDVSFAVPHDNLAPVPIVLVDLQNQPGRTNDERMGIESAKGVSTGIHSRSPRKILFRNAPEPLNKFIRATKVKTLALLAREFHLPLS